MIGDEGFRERGREVTSEPDAGDDAALTRNEEELVPRTTTEQVGSIRLRKHVDTYPVKKVVAREVEHAETGEPVGPNENDSGKIETLADGSVSVPVFEEELDVTKRLVVRERVIVRKATITDKHRIEAELRRERIEVDTDPGIEDMVESAEGDQAPGANASEPPTGTTS